MTIYVYVYMVFSYSYWSCMCIHIYICMICIYICLHVCIFRYAYTCHNYISWLVIDFIKTINRYMHDNYIVQRCITIILQILHHIHIHIYVYIAPRHAILCQHQSKSCHLTRNNTCSLSTFSRQQKENNWNFTSDLQPFAFFCLLNWSTSKQYLLSTSLCFKCLPYRQRLVSD